jgi:hypothetical protein
MVSRISRKTLFLSIITLGLTLAIAGVSFAKELTKEELGAIVVIILGGTDYETDSDGDGIPDIEDAFPNNPKENKDSDRDGVGDNSDVFPFDPSKSNAVVVNFSSGNVSSIVLNTDAVSLGSGSARISRNSGNKATEENNNIIAYDSAGNEVANAVETSDTLFVAESVLSPDGTTLFLLTSPHMQRALNLPPEVCSLYKVTLATESVECLIAAAGDVQPKILNSRAIYSASRKGLDFRADGAAVLYALNYERPLPDGISGGTQNGYAWLMSPTGELTGIDPTENFFIWDALWLDDVKIALWEKKYQELEGDEQHWRIYDTTTQSNASGSPVNANDPSTAARGPLGLMTPGEVITKGNLETLSREAEGRVIEDINGNFFGLSGGYFRQIDTDGASYTELKIKTTQNEAGEPNWQKQSGVGTDVKYSQVASNETFFAHTQGQLPRTPITSIEGQNWGNAPLEIVYDDGNVTVNFGSSSTSDWWGVTAMDEVGADVVVNYKVSTGAGASAAEEDRTLTIPAAAINAWLAYDGDQQYSDIYCKVYLSMDTCLLWANPEPFEEGFCLHKYGTDPDNDRCVQFNQTGIPSLAYKVLRTDMESLRQKRFDDEAVYPDQNGNAFPGVQTVSLIDGRLQAYFKDSRDHQYYVAVADANNFWEEGDAALLFAPAKNSSGDNVIITDATSLTPLPPLPLDGVDADAELEGDLVVVSIELPAIKGYEFNLFADIPAVSVSPSNSNNKLSPIAAPKLTAANILTVEYSAEDFVSGQIYKAELPQYFMVNGSIRRRTPATQLLFNAP